MKLMLLWIVLRLLRSVTDRLAVLGYHEYDIIRTASLFFYQKKMLQLFILFSGIVNLVMGLMLVFGSDRKRGLMALISFSFVTFLWSLSNYFIYRTHDPIFLQLSYAFGAIVAVCLLYWIYFFSIRTEGEFSWDFFTTSIALIGGFFTVAAFFDGAIATNIMVDPVVGLKSDDGLFSAGYIGFILLTYTIVVIQLVRYYRAAARSFDPQKKQILFILFGFITYGGLSLICGLILPFFGYNKLIDFDVPSSMFFVASVTYVVIRYQWLNIRLIGVVFITILIAALSLMQVFLADSFGERVYKATIFVILSFLSISLVRNFIEDIRRKEELQVIADRLALANQELKRLDNAKSEFISIASHQLRTPLTAIKGYTSLILEGNYGKIDSQLQDVVNKVYAANTRLIDLVENLLSISRLESGRMQYNFQPTQVEDIVTDLGNMFAVSAKKRGLDFSVVLPEQPLPKVDLDPAKMREVMSNLIDNAIKYTESGTVTVSLWQEGDKLRYSVKDTGIGVTAEDKERLFSKFSRSKETEKLYVGGTGLGLYVGKTFVEKHGGRIWVESAGRGRGSEFVFELPISRGSL